MDRIVIRWRAMVVVCAVLVAAFGWAFWRNQQDLAAAQAQAALRGRVLSARRKASWS